MINLSIINLSILVKSFYKKVLIYFFVSNYAKKPRHLFGTEVVKEPGYAFGIQVKGLKQAVESKKVVSDAIFTRNGYVHLIEIDNTRQMSDNIKKIKKYESMWDDIKQKYKLQPILYFFTVSENRKRKLAAACKNLRAEVYSFSDIK